LQMTDRRVDINGEFDFVGLLFLNDMPVCTVSILEHGFIALARHCLDGAWFANASANTKLTFLHLEFRPAKGATVRIDGSSFNQISGDGGTNDLAYIRYPSDLTSEKIKLPIFDLMMDRFTTTPSLFTVGYPMPDKVQHLERMISSTCQTDGRQGELTGFTQIYQGELFGTTCPAWYGSSGSLLFSQGDLPGHLKVWGTLAHTFSVDANGDPLSSAIMVDAWGRTTDSNFSPLFLAHDFPQPTSTVKLTEASAQGVSVH
jgi:hypothetical protein